MVNGSLDAGTPVTVQNGAGLGGSGTDASGATLAGFDLSDFTATGPAGFTYDFALNANILSVKVAAAIPGPGAIAGLAVA